MPTSPHPFLKPVYCRWKRPSKLLPKEESCFYLRPAREQPHDSHRVLTQGWQAVKTRNITWEGSPQSLPSPQSLATANLGGGVNPATMGWRKCGR